MINIALNVHRRLGRNGASMMRYGQHCTLALALCFPAVALAQTDTDGDGASDVNDAYPCDPAVAAVAFMPAEGQHGVLLFEDQWPAIGDGDFNDAVLSYNYVVRQDAQGRAVAITATFNALALGGLFDNGFGVHLPVPASAVGLVTRTVGTGSPQPLAASGLDSELTVLVSTNMREFFGNASGQINAIAGATSVSQAVQLDIELTTPTSLNLGAGPFDVYIVRSNDLSHEIHRTMYSGTAAMNNGLFNTNSDQSGPGRAFIDGRNLPFVLNTPTYSAHAKEATDIAQLWPRILNFAASGGTQDQDYYIGDTQQAAAFTGSTPLQPALLSSLPVASTACIAPPGVCGGSSLPVVALGVTYTKVSAKYNMTLTVPPGTGPGTVLIAGITSNNHTSVTPPLGWTLVQDGQASGNCGSHTFVRVVGPTDASSYSFQFQYSTYGSAILSAYSNADPTSPVDASSHVVTSGYTATGISTTSNNGLLAMVVSSGNGAWRWSAPSGWGIGYGGGQNSTSTGVFHRAQPTAGAVGAVTASPSGNDTGHAHLIGLRAECP